MVVVRGDLDVAGIGAVRQALIGVESAEPAALALDLREVEHLDSSGLRLMLDAQARAADAGCRFVVVAAERGAVGRLLSLTMLTDHFEVVRDLVAIHV